MAWPRRSIRPSVASRSTRRTVPAWERPTPIASVRIESPGSCASNASAEAVGPASGARDEVGANDIVADHERERAENVAVSRSIHGHFDMCVEHRHQAAGAPIEAMPVDCVCRVSLAYRSVEHVEGGREFSADADCPGKSRGEIMFSMIFEVHPRTDAMGRLSRPRPDAQARARAGPEPPDGNPLPPGNVRARWGAMSVAYRPDTLATFH